MMAACISGVNNAELGTSALLPPNIEPIILVAKGAKSEAGIAITLVYH
jgi:hypothetical protein